MDQQVDALGSVQRALMPAMMDAPPRRGGCRRHKVRRRMVASFVATTCRSV